MMLAPQMNIDGFVSSINRGKKPGASALAAFEKKMQHEQMAMIERHLPNMEDDDRRRAGKTLKFLRDRLRGGK